MTFSQLALSNIKGHALRYSAFFLSSTFSVMLLYIYAQFVFHPDVLNGQIYGGENSRVVLATCLVLIGVFAFFFVLYSSGAFLRSRSQEFGLLSLMGTTRGQLRKLVWLENTLISMAAIGLGMLLGLLFSKLFLLGISRILSLEEAIRFTFVPFALLITVAGFLVLFQLVTLVSSFNLGRRQIIDLLRAARKPRQPPRTNVLIAVTGIILIAGSYAASFGLDANLLVIAFVPVTSATVIGTYMLVSQGSLFFLNLARRNKERYLRGTRMITVSQLVYRMVDNSRLLATIASLSAVVLAGAGTFYTFNSFISNNIEQIMPQEFSVLEPAVSSSAVVTVDAVRQLLDAYPTVEPTMDCEAQFVNMQLNDQAVTLTPASTVTGLEELGTRFELVPDANMTVRFTEDGPVAAEEGTVLPAMTPIGLNQPGWLIGSWHVVPDEQWAEVSMDSDAVAKALFLDWEESSAARELSRELAELLTQDPVSGFWVINRQAELSAVRSTFGLSLFAGLFISLLFFIGSASLIYFKLFTELPDDRATYGRLERIGMTWQETVRTVSTQIGFVFLLPFALGALHAFVALDAFGSILSANVTTYSLVVIGLFAVVQLAFYLLTRWTYLRALRPAA